MNVKAILGSILHRPNFLDQGAQKSLPAPVVAEVPVQPELHAAEITADTASAPVSLVTWAQSFGMLMELEQMLDRNDPAARHWLQTTLPSLRRTLGDAVASFAVPIQRSDYINALNPVKAAIALCLRQCGNPG
jgi:hypothetical protein